MSRWGQGRTGQDQEEGIYIEKRRIGALGELTMKLGRVLVLISRTHPPIAAE